MKGVYFEGTAFTELCICRHSLSRALLSVSFTLPVRERWLVSWWNSLGGGILFCNPKGRLSEMGNALIFGRNLWLSTIYTQTWMFLDQLVMKLFMSLYSCFILTFGNCLHGNIFGQCMHMGLTCSSVLVYMVITTRVWETTQTVSVSSKMVNEYLLCRQAHELILLPPIILSFTKGQALPNHLTALINVGLTVILLKLL